MILCFRLIFMFLPLVLDASPLFVDSVFSEGEHPWLLILFLTTFGHWVMLWIFVITALIIRPMTGVMRAVSAVIDVAREPVVGIAVALIVAVTAIYLFGAGGAALYKSLT